jgi:rubrerythrin
MLRIAIAVAAMLGAVNAIRRHNEIIRERTAKRLCLHCGYPLTGNVSRDCPECGEPDAEPAH